MTKHDPVGRNQGNSRNGVRAKTVLTEIGPAEIVVPRDTDASFTPQIVKKRFEVPRLPGHTWRHSRCQACVRPEAAVGGRLHCQRCSVGWRTQEPLG